MLQITEFMSMKYALTDEVINTDGTTLYRIRSLKYFGDVKYGDLGGFVESEDNLLHKGDCWVSGNAKVYSNARVCEDALVYGYAVVYGNATVSGNARVAGCARVYGNALVCEWAQIYMSSCIYGNAQVCGDAHVLGNAHVCGDAYVGGCDVSIDLQGDVKLDHGVWTREIKLDGKHYLLSSTLELTSEVGGSYV